MPFIFQALEVAGWEVAAILFIKSRHLEARIITGMFVRN